MYEPSFPVMFKACSFLLEDANGVVARDRRNAPIFAIFGLPNKENASVDPATRQFVSVYDLDSTYSSLVRDVSSNNCLPLDWTYIIGVRTRR